MKKTFTKFKYAFLIVVAVFVASSSTYAQTSTPSSSLKPTPKEEGSASTLDKIRLLKEKVATKVAELRKSDKKAIHGTIVSLSYTEFKLKTPKNETITVTFSEDTPGNIKDIAEGREITAFGYYDETVKTLDGRVVYLTESIPSFLSGKIADIDR